MYNSLYRAIGTGIRKCTLYAIVQVVGQVNHIHSRSLEKINIVHIYHCGPEMICTLKKSIYSSLFWQLEILGLFYLGR